jgi:hypothetical protein
MEARKADRMLEGVNGLGISRATTFLTDCTVPRPTTSNDRQVLAHQGGRLLRDAVQSLWRALISKVSAGLGARHEGACMRQRAQIRSRLNI